MSKKKFSILGSELADIGFYINLSSSSERKKNVNSQIKKFQITGLKRVEAVTDPWFQTSCTKSHLKIFELCRQKNFDVVAVFEDDFQLYDDVYIYEKNLTTDFRNYLKVFSSHIQNIDWDIILLGFNGRKFNIPISKHLTENYKSTGAWGYLIKKRAMDFILDNFDYSRDYLAIDNILPEMTYRGFKSYASIVQLVHHGVGFISTLNPQGPVNYDVWIEGNYHGSVWLEKPKCNSFKSCLSELYERDKKIKNEIYKIQNYNGDYEKLNKFLDENPTISKSFIIVENNEKLVHKIREVNYTFSQETRCLLHFEPSFNFEKLNLGKKINLIDFEKIKINSV